MNSLFFSESYYPDDFNIINLDFINNNLKMTAIMNTYIELIANGYRPEMNISQTKTFIFKSITGIKTITKPFIINKIYYDTKLHLVINNNDFIVNDDSIDIE